MKITSPFAPFSRLKRSTDPEEFNRILDLFPQAVLLVDSNLRKVVAANIKASELSAYSRHELNHKPLDELFTNLDGTDFHTLSSLAGDSIPLSLVRRNSSILEVHAEIHEIAGDNPWIFVSLEPLSAIQHHQTERQQREMLLEKFSSLSSATQLDEMQSALELILSVGHALTAASMLAIYQADGKNLELKCSAQIGGTLPERLPSQDLIHLHSPQIWTPGKRAHSTLHSFARSEHLTYLASVPVGDPNATVGLIIAADPHNPPEELLLSILHMLASETNSLFHYFYRFQNLEGELQRQLRYRRFAEAAQNTFDDILIVASNELKVVRLNRAGELALGYTNAEAHNLPVQDILIGKDNLLPALNIALGGIPTLNQENLRFYRRSGEAFQSRVNIIPVKERDQVEGLIILVKDMSDQVSAKNYAEQLEQPALLGTVTAIFAHEVRNPINNISTGLQLMAYNLQPGDPQLELISKLQQECDRLEDLMKSVLTFSRTTEYEMEPVDLSLLVSRLIERLRPKLTKAKVDYHIKADADTPLILGNPRALDQVFTNLFTNAIQAMEATGGILAIKVQPSETTGKRRQALVIVGDNGPGIPKENLDKIFTPFFTTKSSGTGLGLAITKRIVTAHKGIILVNSFPGGTIFSVQIPAMEPPQDDFLSNTSYVG